jgi:hypothetical protein
MLDNIKKINIHKEPIPYIVINGPIDLKDYDSLYEQWNNPTHSAWTNFLNKHKVTVDLKNNLTSNNQSKQKEYVGYWFFQQRTDRRDIRIQFGDTKIGYEPNRLLILDSEQTFSVINKGAKLPNTLNCTVYFNSAQQNKIREFLSL